MLFVFGGGGFFPLINLPVVLVYGYGRGSCHLDFCVDVCLPDRRWARASVPLLEANFVFADKKYSHKLCSMCSTGVHKQCAPY
jgi:hypothetical protein